MVPLAGLVAKLTKARKAPNEQNTKAAKTRGLKIPDSDVDFFCMIRLSRRLGAAVTEGAWGWI